MKRILRLSVLMAIAAAMLAFYSVETVSAQVAPVQKGKAINANLNAAAGIGEFVDLDGDGICDNFQSGMGLGLGQRRGAGQGQNFIDADGDGVCDLAGTNAGQRNGQRRGFGQRLNGVDMNGTGVCDGTGAGLGGMHRRGGRGPIG